MTALLRFTTWWHQHITKKVRSDLHSVRSVITEPVPLERDPRAWGLDRAQLP